MVNAINIRRAVLSVYDKQGIEVLGRRLADRNIEIISTGGTSKKLKEAGVPVRAVREITDVPEMLNGRVKTLHPKLLGGILYRRDLAEHEQAVEEHGLSPIDLVVVNLYPFSQTIQQPGCTLAQAVEQIDIGGPTMVRSAAKNHAAVTVVVDPNDYDRLAAEIEEHGGTTEAFRRQLAAKAFRHTFEYDTTIADYLDSVCQSES